MAWVSTVISVPLSIYLFVVGNAVRELDLYVSPASAEVVRAGQSSRLLVSFDGRPIASDISASQVAIWNSGRLSIKKENILKPVIIITDPPTPILEVTLRSVSRDVTGLALDGSELAQGRVRVGWNILEQNDGALLQLIYAGKPIRGANLECIVEGPVRTQTPDGVGQRLLRFASFLVGLGSVMAVVVLATTMGKQIPGVANLFSESKSVSGRLFQAGTTVFLLLFLIVMGLYFASLVIPTGRTRPPSKLSPDIVPRYVGEG